MFEDTLHRQGASSETENTSCWMNVLVQPVLFNFLMDVFYASSEHYTAMIWILITLFSPLCSVWNQNCNWKREKLHREDDANDFPGVCARLWEAACWNLCNKWIGLVRFICAENVLACFCGVSPTALLKQRCLKASSQRCHRRTITIPFLLLLSNLQMSDLD